MNDIKQFLKTKTGLVLCGILVLIIGIYIGSGDHSQSASPIVDAPPVTAPVAVATSTSVAEQPAPAPVKKAPAPVQTKTVVAAPAQTAPAPVQAQPVQPTTAPTPTPTPTWHTAYTTSGTTGTKTPPFTLQGAEQRITYSCSILDASNPYGGSFNGIINATTGQGAGDVFAGLINCPASNTVYEYSLSPGQYYLDLGPNNNSSYTVTIEDRY